MNYHYEDFLTEKLNLIKQDLGMNINLEVYEEQIFVKMKTFTPNTIYVIIKYLSSNITLEATLQPVQIMILSEQNSMEIARTLFNEFANRYNWFTDIQDNIYTKHQYSTPVVLICKYYYINILLIKKLEKKSKIRNLIKLLFIIKLYHAYYEWNSI